MNDRYGFKVIQGPVTRILGSHRTTDISISEHSSTHPAAAPGDHHHTETHTFVNTAREFVMLLEVEGYTLKLVSADYIALVEGDVVRAICQPIPHGPFLVVDWLNKTRGIAFRSVPRPTDGWAPRLVFIVVMTALGAGFVVSDTPLVFKIVGTAVLVAALLLIVEGVRAFRSRDHAHAALDRLAKGVC